MSGLFISRLQTPLQYQFALLCHSEAMGLGHSEMSPEETELTAADLLSKISSLHDDYINIGVDETLLLYSGTNSTASLLDYSSSLQGLLEDRLPDFVEKAAGALGGFTPVPNAVGLGAFVISMILQLALSIVKGSPEPKTALQSVFAEEKSSMIRDLIVEYLKRYEMHLRNDHWLLANSERVEAQLSLQLSIVRNSILVDRQISPRAINHWVNGAAFHTQVLLHIARLRKTTTEGSQDFESAKRVAMSAVDIYDRDMKKILEVYKEYKKSKFDLRTVTGGAGAVRVHISWCTVKEYEINYFTELDSKYCEVERKSPDYYFNYIYSNQKKIRELEIYFPNIQKNLEVLVNQKGTFQIKS